MVQPEPIVTRQETRGMSLPQPMVAKATDGSELRCYFSTVLE